MVYKGKNNEYISLEALSEGDKVVFDDTMGSPLIIIWTKDDRSQVLFEGKIISLPKNTLVCLTKFFTFQFISLKSASQIKFNREFYCVLDHDKEVGCKGVLFFGANQLPYFQIPEGELEKFETVWKMFEIEIQTSDEMQLEMLQTMLKRILILCTRIYKSENALTPLQLEESDIIRAFNFLVEKNFKTNHSVQSYAEMLNKSPKTLANLFSKISDKTPLRIIHERISIEARRLLLYTDMTIKEIAFELNFEDIQTFSRFFKKMEKKSPSEFKNLTLGKIAKP